MRLSIFHRRKLLSMLGLFLVLVASIIGGIRFTYIKGRTNIKLYGFVGHRILYIELLSYLVYEIFPEQCKDLDSPGNGSVTITKIEDNVKKAEYSCNPGFKLIEWGPIQHCDPKSKPAKWLPAKAPKCEGINIMNENNL